AIQALPAIASKFFKEQGDSTGWCFRLVAGGPHPSLGGDLDSFTLDIGKDKDGKRFNQVRNVNSHQEEFLGWLEGVFPHDVRQSRALSSKVSPEPIPAPTSSPPPPNALRRRHSPSADDGADSEDDLPRKPANALEFARLYHIDEETEGELEFGMNVPQNNEPADESRLPTPPTVDGSQTTLPAPTSTSPAPSLAPNRSVGAEVATAAPSPAPNGSLTARTPTVPSTPSLSSPPPSDSLSAAPPNSAAPAPTVSSVAPPPTPGNATTTPLASSTAPPPEPADAAPANAAATPMAPPSSLPAASMAPLSAPANAATATAASPSTALPPAPANVAATSPGSSTAPPHAPPGSSMAPPSAPANAATPAASLMAPPPVPAKTTAAHTVAIATHEDPSPNHQVEAGQGANGFQALAPQDNTPTPDLSTATAAASTPEPQTGRRIRKPAKTRDLTTVTGEVIESGPPKRKATSANRTGSKKRKV
ncbi:hypothetical protein BDN72DRAFT_893317, partial [Pluteus cervinus]